jgi:hypothetical protein
MVNFFGWFRNWFSTTTTVAVEVKARDSLHHATAITYYKVRKHSARH